MCVTLLLLRKQECDYSLVLLGNINHLLDVHILAHARLQQQHADGVGDKRCYRDMTFHPESPTQEPGGCARQHFGVAVVGGATFFAFLQSERIGGLGLVSIKQICTFAIQNNNTTPWVKAIIS